MTGTFNFENVSSTLSQSLDEKLQWISGFIGLLSIGGCIVNIALTLYLGKSKFTIGKMVIMLATFDIFNHLPFVLFSFASMGPLTCQIGAAASYFGFASSIFFTTCFAHALYQSLKQGSIECVEKYYKKYIALSVLAGVIVGSLTVALQYKIYYQFDDGTSACITRLTTGFPWGALLLLVIPGTISILGCLFYSLRIMSILWSLNERYHWGPLVYPLILIICILPTLVRKYCVLIGIELKSEVYTEISYLLFGAQGFLNSLAYGLSREICEKVKCLCSSRKRTESSQSSFLSMTEEESQSPKERKSTLEKLSI